MMKKIIYTSIWLIAPLFLAAQSFSGRIIDKDNNEPVEGAYVQILKTKQSAVTDAGGTFLIEEVTAPEFQVSVSHLSFETVVMWANASDGRLTIELTARPVTTETILVEAGSKAETGFTDILYDARQSLRSPRDVGDLFAGEPGFGLVKRGGYAMDPVFRGLKYEQLNVQYDGGVQVSHACPNRMDPVTTHVIPEEIEEIELIKGPFSVRYGPTMGAVLNIVTQRVKPTETFDWGGELASGYELNGNGHSTRLLLQAADRRFDAVLVGGLKDFNNYKSGAGREVPSSFQSYDYSFKGGYKPSADQRLQVSWRQSFARDILHVTLPMDTDEDNSSILALDYTHRNLSPLLANLAVKVYGSQIDHVMSNARRPNFMMMEAVATVQSQTLGGRFELSLAPSRDLAIFAGLDHRSLRKDGSRERLVKRNMMTGEPLPMPMSFTDLIWQDSRLHNTGVFVEGRWNNGPLRLTAGLRTDYITSDIKDPAPDFAELYGSNLTADPEINLSLNATANYRLTEKMHLGLALGRGVRTANLIERYINHFTVGVDPFEYVGNPQLNPEANNQAEVSLDWQDDRLQLRLSGFYAYMTDFITGRIDSLLPRKYMPMNEPRFSKRFVNLDEAQRLGFETSIDYRIWKGLHAKGTAAFTRAQNLDWDEPLPEIPPLEATLGLRYEGDTYKVQVNGRFVDTQDQVAVSFGEGATPGFSVFDFRADVTPWPFLTVGAAVYNIFDRNYFEHLNRRYVNMPESEWLYEPGRNLRLDLRVRF